jgi:hypothetical protein
LRSRLGRSETAAAETQKLVADQEALLAAAQNEQTALLQKRLELQEQITKLPIDKKEEAALLHRDLDEVQGAVSMVRGPFCPYLQLCEQYCNRLRLGQMSRTAEEIAKHL